MPWRVSRPPRWFRNSAPFDPGRPSPAGPGQVGVHRRSPRSGPRGTTRSLFPLPITRTLPSSMSTSSTSSADQLRDAQAGAVQRLQDARCPGAADGTVPARRGDAGPRRRPPPAGGEGSGERLRPGHAAGGVLRRVALDHQEPVEASGPRRGYGPPTTAVYRFPARTRRGERPSMNAADPSSSTPRRVVDAPLPQVARRSARRSRRYASTVLRDTPRSTAR